MAEYIEREKAIDAMTERNLVVHMDSVNDGLVASCHRSAQRIIANLPAADVWEVVHCADCAHAEESLVSGCVYCNEMERARIKEGFCAWGERKTNDG